MSRAELSESHPFRSDGARERYLAHYDAWAELWPIASEVRTLETDHGRTLVRISGPRDAPPLVLLPARGSHSLGWTPMIQALSEVHRTYAVDSIYDFGRSVNARPATGIEDYTGWLDELFDALGLGEGVNLLGLSRGAWMSAEYLVRAPQRLAKVVWLSPGALLFPYSRVLLLQAVLGVPMMLAPSHRTVDWTMRWMMPDWAESDGPTRDRYDRFVDGMAEGIRCFDLAKIDFMRIERVIEDSELRDIKVPVLYVAGEREKMYSAASGAARLKAVAPQIETAVIPGAGHDLVPMQPEAVARIALEFLEAE
jgi:pimeloyl-ACP methyl ester carboxylesterase